ncbi:MAG: hypothetical protein GX639_20125 [Fibrobacter sp.]|nr:hypothetical protein [Fibrobacter sp.]
MEKFNLLLTILRDLQKEDILKHFVLVGSWCLEFYRHIYNNPIEIPATRTMDADILIPKQLPKSKKVHIVDIMEKNDFITEIEYMSGLYKFTHINLSVEFLTDPGSKPDEGIYAFKQLGITAQELRYMSIPLSYKLLINYDDISLFVPEPEAFTLHKLIVCGLRRNPDKAVKDTETAIAMLTYFNGKDQHIKRLHEIYNDLHKGWRSKIDESLLKIGMTLPIE